MRDDTRDAAKEVRRCQRLASQIWTQVRTAAKQTRFTDPPALRSVKYAVDRALGSGVVWRDIEQALREHGKDPYTRSPWFLDVWAAQIKTARENAETAALPVGEQLARMRAARR